MIIFVNNQPIDSDNMTEKERELLQKYAPDFYLTLPQKKVEKAAKTVEEPTV